MAEQDSELDAASIVLTDAQFADVYAGWKRRIEGVLREEGRWAIVGIKRRGSILAQRLWEEFREGMPELEFGEVDISLYRDDYHLNLLQPRVMGSRIEFAVDGCGIVLVDDVLYTGRTIQAALSMFRDYGRPRRVLLSVFVDRGHRELPIAPDIVGIEIRTEKLDRVKVYLRELDESDRLLLFKADEAT